MKFVVVCGITQPVPNYIRILNASNFALKQQILIKKIFSEPFYPKLSKNDMFVHVKIRFDEFCGSLW